MSSNERRPPVPSEVCMMDGVKKSEVSVLYNMIVNITNDQGSHHGLSKQQPVANVIVDI